MKNHELNWPSVVLALGVIAGAVTTVVFMPEHLAEKLWAADWRAVGGWVLMLCSALGLTQVGPAIRRKVLQRFGIVPLSDPPPSPERLTALPPPGGES